MPLSRRSPRTVNGVTIGRARAAPRPACSVSPDRSARQRSPGRARAPGFRSRRRLLTPSPPRTAHRFAAVPRRRPVRDRRRRFARRGGCGTGATSRTAARTTQAVLGRARRGRGWKTSSLLRGLPPRLRTASPPFGAMAGRRARRAGRRGASPRDVSLNWRRRGGRSASWKGGRERLLGRRPARRSTARRPVGGVGRRAVVVADAGSVGGAREGARRRRRRTPRGVGGARPAFGRRAPAAARRADDGAPQRPENRRAAAAAASMGPPGSTASMSSASDSGGGGGGGSGHHRRRRRSRRRSTPRPTTSTRSRRRRWRGASHWRRCTPDTRRPAALAAEAARRREFRSASGRGTAGGRSARGRA